MLLGDPPIDWAQIHSHADLQRFLAVRDRHFAQVIQEQVLAKGRKALVIVGSGHLLRRDPLLEQGPHIRFGKGPPPGPGPAGEKFFFVVPPPMHNLAQLIEKDHPGTMFIVLPHDGKGPGSGKIERRYLTSWPVPALAKLGGTPLGAVPASQILGGGKFFKDGKLVDSPPAEAATGPRLEDIADALLYLGRAQTLGWDPDTDYSGDAAFTSELKRRKDLPGAPQMPVMVPHQGGRLIEP